MLAGLIDIDPANAAYYSKNHDMLQTRLDSLDCEISEILRQRPSASFITWHPSLSYFARDYSLNQIALGSDNKELSADNFRNKVNDARRHNASAFIVQPEFDQNRSKEIALQAGADTVRINLLTYDWAGEMIRTAKAIAGIAK